MRSIVIILVIFVLGTKAQFGIPPGGIGAKVDLPVPVGNAPAAAAKLEIPAGSAPLVPGSRQEGSTQGPPPPPSDQPSVAPPPENIQPPAPPSPQPALPPQIPSGQPLRPHPAQFPLNIVPLENGAVYEIVNKGDGGALTVDSVNSIIIPAVSRGYNGAAGQKWRLEKATFGRSFRFIPTMKEFSVLDLDRNNMGFWGRIFTFGNQKYWNMINVGNGLWKIQNWQLNDLCLTSKGLGKEVDLDPCVNSPAQQFEFILL